MTSRQGYGRLPRTFIYCSSCGRPFDATAHQSLLCLRCTSKRLTRCPTREVARFEHIPGDISSAHIEAIIDWQTAQQKHQRITQLNRACEQFAVGG